jgi:hypothetical protein
MRRWTLLLAFVLAGCAKGGDADPEGAPEKSPPITKSQLHSTRDLGLSAETAALVDALGAHGRIESSHVGAAGAPSAVYKAYEAVAARVTAEDAKKLLGHESPVVRGYLAGHVLRKQPADAAAVYPLLADGTEVGSLEGCEIGSTTVGEHVAGELASVLAISALGTPAHDEAGKLALRVAGDATLPVPMRNRMVRDAANYGARGVDAVARGMLRERDEQLVSGGLDALYLLGAPGSTLAEVEPFARHGTPTVRRAAAALLGHLDDPGALALLTTLESDRDSIVSQSARAASARHPSRDRASVLVAMADKKEGRVVMTGLMHLATPWAIGLLVEHVRANPTNAWALSGIRRTRDEAVLAPLRRIAAETGEGEGFVKSREAAALYLKGVGEPSLHEGR